MVQTLQAQSAATSGVASSYARSSDDISSASIREPEPSSFFAGHLSKQGGGRVRYVESSFWASMCQEVADLDDLLGSQGTILGCILPLRPETPADP